MDELLKITIDEGSTFKFKTEDLKALDIQQLPNGQYHILDQHKSIMVEVVSVDWETKMLILRLKGRDYQITVSDHFDEIVNQMATSNKSTSTVQKITAPMPGIVLDVKVMEGSTVKKGDTLLIIEAMKMENALKATRDGIVDNIKVVPQQKIEKGEVLCVIQLNIN